MSRIGADAFTIQLATAADSAHAVEVVKEVYDEYGFGWFPDTYHADLYDLDSYYLKRGFPFWIAFSASQKPLGTVSLEWIDPPIPAGNGIQMVDGYERAAGADCALNRLYVSPQTRRMGIGEALVKTVISFAQASGKKKLELWSDKRFEKAHKLYEKLGAKVIGDRICHDPEQSPEWGLLLEL